MEYELSGLGSKNFEHMVQSLATRTLGPRVSTFGAGADGGREATWDGDARSLGVLSDWNGYGVVQAKYADFVTDTASGLAWIKSRVSEELAEWARTDSKRTRKPDFILFATNVRLSPVPGYGKDAIKTHVAEKIREFKLPILDFRVWDHDDMASLLDNAEDVRRRYSAFITAGDIIAQLLDEKNDRDRRVSRALRASVARSLSDDSHIGLTQAGAMGDSRVTIADVFVDLPVERQLVDSVDELDTSSEEPSDDLEQEYSPDEELARFVDQQKPRG